MKQEIIKPFNLKKAQAGAKLRTIEGYSVEIFKWDARGEYPIKGIISSNDGDSVAGWDLRGKAFQPEDSLVIVEEDGGWISNENNLVSGYFLSFQGSILNTNGEVSFESFPNIYATKKQAKSALAMAKISQIMKNDERFGGVITDEEWNNVDNTAYIIKRVNSGVYTGDTGIAHYFLSFHTAYQRDLFLKENERLVKDYLMID